MKWWLLGCALVLGCRGAEQTPAREQGRSELAPAPAVIEVAQPAYLDGALLEARYDTTTIAQLGRSLPRPQQDETPLAGLFGHIVDALLGDPAARLEAVGLQADAPIELSIRALDGRAASVRKLLRELSSDAEPAPELVAKLADEARTLGVHLRATLPVRDRTRLLRTLAGLTIGDDDRGVWAQACDSLDDVALCSARPRLVLWARGEGEDRLRVDGVYFFYDGAPAPELAWALARADGWATRRDAPAFGRAAAIELRIHAEPTLTLLETEALADAAMSFVDPSRELDYPAYVSREQALRELVPEARVFDGLDLDLDYDAGQDRLRVTVGWLPALRTRTNVAELFAPVIEPGTLPVLDGDCAAAQACGRIAGVSSLPRFAALAEGAFADSTGAARVLRQSGDRGLILLGMVSWPNLLGTAGRMALDSGGLMAKTESSLLSDSFGAGFMLLSPGDELEHYVAYLRLGNDALAAMRRIATLVGLSLRPLSGGTGEADEAVVERGSYDGVSVYLVDETPRRGGFGGWLMAADADTRVEWLLDTPREPSEPDATDPIVHLRFTSIGPIAGHEQVAFSDDPAVRRWLDQRGLELHGHFRAGGPVLEIVLEPTRLDRVRGVE